MDDARRASARDLSSRKALALAADKLTRAKCVGQSSIIINHCEMFVLFIFFQKQILGGGGGGGRGHGGIRIRHAWLLRRVLGVLPASEKTY